MFWTGKVCKKSPPLTEVRWKAVLGPLYGHVEELMNTKQVIITDKFWFGARAKAAIILNCDPSELDVSMIGAST